MSYLHRFVFFVALAPACFSPSPEVQEVRGGTTPTAPAEARMSELAEEAEILRTLGLEVLEEAADSFTNRGMTPPSPALMGQCIEARYPSEPEVGYSYAIAQGGVVVTSGAGGFARAPWEAVSPNVLMKDTTRMTLASVSKPITALAVMKLLDETSVKLDDPFYPLIADQYGGWRAGTDGKLMFVPHSGVDTITIRNLLTHRSGLQPGLGCGKIVESLAGFLVGTPGVTYDYENANFCILREVIEAVSGMDYMDYVQSKILTPAGIFDMNCTPDAVDPALYYNTIGSAGKNWGDYTSICSAFGWYGSAVDLATLAGQLRVGAILDQTDIDTMLGNCPNTDTNGYCLGWRRSSKAALGGDYFGHSGAWISKKCGGNCNRGLDSTIRRYGLGIDAALIVNTWSGDEGYPILTSTDAILDQCYAEALAAANP